MQRLGYLPKGTPPGGGAGPGILALWRSWAWHPGTAEELGLASWHCGPRHPPHSGLASLLSPHPPYRNPENFGILQKSRPPGGDVCVYSRVFHTDIVIGGRRVFFLRIPFI